MRWQTTARATVALVGVGVAVALFRSTRERPTAFRPATVTIADPSATVQGSGGRQIRYRGDDKQFTLAYTSVRQLADGRTMLEGVTMTAEDGSVVTADFAETRGKLAGEELPAELLFKGHLRLKTTEGAEVTAEEGTYQQLTGRLSLPGPVAFTRGRVSGTGVGGAYERDTGQFMLISQAQVAGAERDGQPGFTGRAESLTFNRASKALLFDRAASVSTATSTMTADRSTVYLTDDTEQFRVIELRGNARVVPQQAAGGGVPDMRAVDMDLSFHQGTQAFERAILTREAVMVIGEGASRQSIAGASIVAETAPDGRTLTKLEARERVSVKTPARDGVPERTTTAAAMVATGDAKRGLTGALFTGGVTFVETMAGARGRSVSERRATSDTLSMALGGKLDQIEEARFERNVVFKDGDLTGDADIGVYRAAKGQLGLQPATIPSRRPHVKSADIDVEAGASLDIDLGTQDVHAVGDVKTVFAGSRKPGSSGAALFDEATPTHGFGREFWYTSSARRARYVGTGAAPAVVRQGDRSVTATSVELGTDGGDLTARGAVESVLILDQAAAAKSGMAARQRVVADSFEYREAKRTATYLGLPAAPVVMTGENGVTEAQRIVLTLASASRTIDRLDADGHVRLTLTGGREALADVLVYDVSAGRYILRGTTGPAVMKEPTKKPTICDVSRFREVRFARDGGAPEFPDSAGGTLAINRPCAEPLTR